MLKPLMCGGFTLEVAVLWFSSGNTKSVLHKDNVENINCIFDGDKDIVFVDKVSVSQTHVIMLSGQELGFRGNTKSQSMIRLT